MPCRDHPSPSYSPSALVEPEPSRRTPRKDEADKVKSALAAWGCEAGAEIEKEQSGIFELDDVKCKEGQYDVKVDKDFKLLSLTRD